MKKCPQCAEEIQDEAIVCRYCGARFDGVPAAAFSQARPIAPTTNGFAIASLVLGIVWMWWIGSVLALVFGYKARREIQDSAGAQTGAGMATAGIVLGWIGVVAAVLFVVLALAAVSVGGQGVQIETFDVPMPEM